MFISHFLPHVVLPFADVKVNEGGVANRNCSFSARVSQAVFRECRPLLARLGGARVTGSPTVWIRALGTFVTSRVLPLGRALCYRRFAFHFSHPRPDLYLIQISIKSCLTNNLH